MADFHFYTDTMSRMSSTLDTYVSDVSTAIAGGFAGVATTLVTIYVMLWGWSMMRGVISEPVTDGVSRIVRLAVIVGLATNVGLYNGYISDFLWNLPDALASLIASGYSDSATNANFLDTLFGKAYDFGQAYHEKGYASPGFFPDYGMVAAAWAIWAFGLAATGYAAFLLVLSKIVLAVVLGVGPLFILFLIFEPTKRLFDAWIGQALNYIFVVMLTTATIKLLLTIISAYIDAVFGSYAAVGGADPGYSEIFPMLALSAIGCLALVQMPSIASALGGGVAISSLGAVRWAYDKTTGGVSRGLSAARPTNMRRTLNKARSDWKIAKKAANTTVGVPGAVYRKITGGNRTRRAA
ncbi:MAG: type IV secretion system protein [Gallionellaceae bacterium]|nr:type IV secretion system protein [Gallionellaceae bacterium]